MGDHGHAAPLTELESHFAFGENWESYSKLINSEKIAAAVKGLAKFVGPLDGRSFLDIGCGSGLHDLAALRLGARSVMALDIDPKSVATTKQILAQFAPSSNWQADTISVLSPRFAALGKFDVVYSWGVLHHTGNMRQAIERAAAHVKPGGRFAIAIYAKTPFCGAWRAEKWLYTNSPRFTQDIFFWAYKLTMDALSWIKAKATRTRKVMRRGMDIDHDYRDWLGGYPYESATPAEIDRIVIPLGFEKMRQHVPKRHFAGLFGTGCAEYLFQRQ